MASTTAMCTSFKKELMEKKHDFTTSTGDTFRAALYTSTATHGATTTAYSATNEVAGTAYVAAGVALTNVTPTTNSTSGITDFSDAQWAASTITAASVLIYNDTDAGNAAVSVHDFGGDKSSSGGNFDIVFPAAAAGTAIIELA